MRHRVKGRILSRDNEHRRAMLRNMANSLIRSFRVDEDDPHKPAVHGRIVTTLPKAKELRPFVEKLITLACKAIPHEREAEQFATTAERYSSEWQQWRDSAQWNRWNQAIAPAVAMRRRAYNQLRDKEAVDILFNELAERFEDRPGGYTRIVRLAEPRLGDAAPQALIEFVGERDRVKKGRKRSAPVVSEEEEQESGEEQASATETSATDTASHETQDDETAGSVSTAEQENEQQTTAEENDTKSGS